MSAQEQRGRKRKPAAIWTMEEIERDLRLLIGFDADAGGLWWKEKPNRNTVIGAPIGAPNRRGHLTFTFHGHRWMVHRVIWFLHYGAWPKDQIDHINNIKNDNRICNLRDVDRCANMQNRILPQRNNAAGVRGVNYDEVCTKRPWKACIKVSGKSITLGNYKTKEEASAAYWNAKSKLHDGYASIRALLPKEEG